MKFIFDLILDVEPDDEYEEGLQEKTEERLERVLDNSTVNDALSTGLNATVSLRLVPVSFRRVLEQLVSTVEDTGGVYHDKKGLYQPLGDREWIDLGDIYVQACRALGREPKLATEDEVDE